MKNKTNPGTIEFETTLGVPVKLTQLAKTKEFGKDDKIDVYDEHLMQLAAYRVGLGMPFARCANNRFFSLEAQIHDFTPCVRVGWCAIDCKF